MQVQLVSIPRYLALFFVSAYLFGFGVFLVRFFSLTAGPEYGLGLLAVVLTGMALGAVLLSCWEKFFQRHRPALLFWLPFVLLFVSALAFQVISVIRFNPQLLWHDGLQAGQLLYLGGYALVLVPVLMLIGLYVGLSLLDLSADAVTAATVHLSGVVAGLLLVYLFLYMLHPFYLLAALLPILSLAVLCRLFSLPYGMFLTSLVLIFFVTGFGVWRVVDGNRAQVSGDKVLASAMKVEGNRVTSEILTPGGAYRVLDNFTERRDIDLSGQYGFPRVAAKPVARGLYRDGERLQGLYKGDQIDVAYFTASLDALPYQLRPTGKYLLIGTDGGFKIQELWGEKRTISAVEPLSAVHDLVKAQIGGMAGITITTNSPLAVLEPKGFDVIDLSTGFQKDGGAARYAVTVDAVVRYIVSLKEGGVLSLPIPTAGFSGYAVKMLATVRAALVRTGVKEPGKHVLVYRSALGARIIVSRRALTETEIKAFKTFCGERAFDVSWYPGMDSTRTPVLYDLPRQTLAKPTMVKEGSQTDALRDAAFAMFQTKGAMPPASDLNLAPATLDRPFFYGIVPLSQIWLLGRSGWFLPEAEIGQFIRPVTLIAVVIMAGLVFVLLAVGRRNMAAGPSPLRATVYFACLGLGSAFIIVALGERGAYCLGDQSGANYLVMGATLLFSGWGSFRARRFDPMADRGIKWAVLRIILCLVLYAFMLTPVLSLLISLSRSIKIVIVLLFVSPVAYALGASLALGLASLREKAGFLIPWAWGIITLFLAAAIPLSGLIMLAWGIHYLLFASVMLVFIALWAYPGVSAVSVPKRT